MNEYSSYLCSERGYSDYAYGVYAKRRYQSGSIRLALESMRLAEHEFWANKFKEMRESDKALGMGSFAA